MSRPNYAPRTSYVGDGTLAQYTFDFKIEDLSQLLVIELDSLGAILHSVRGSDLTFLSSVSFDPSVGGGTVNLLVNLVSGHTLILLEANDAPTQPSEFRSKFGFTLIDIENALDRIAGAVQRLAYRMAGAVRLQDATDSDTFDTRLPIGIVGAAGYTIGVNSTGDGFTLFDTADLTVQSSFSILDNQAATDLAGETFDSASFAAAIIDYVVQRGTGVLVSGRLGLTYRNGQWYVFKWGEYMDAGSGPSGVTFTVSGTTIAQLRAACDAGAGNGKLYLRKIRFTK